MSYKNPNPEERNRIVEDVVTNMLSSSYKEKAEDDLARLNKQVGQMRSDITAALKPLVDQAALRSPLDPEYIHSESGRAKLLLTAHGLYLDKIKSFSKDECQFLLALVYGELTLSEFV